jgi:hypothetical protein
MNGKLRATCIRPKLPAQRNVNWSGGLRSNAESLKKWVFGNCFVSTPAAGRALTSAKNNSTIATESQHLRLRQNVTGLRTRPVRRLSRPSKYPAHGSLHRAGAGSVQRRLARLTCSEARPEACFSRSDQRGKILFWDPTDFRKRIDNGRDHFWPGGIAPVA